MSYAIRHTLGCACGSCRAAMGEVAPITGSFVSPGMVAGYLSTIDGSVQALNRDVEARRAAIQSRSSGFLREWSIFVGQWNTWRDEHSGFLSRLTGSTVDAANEWARRYNGWEQQYRAITGESTSAPAATQRSGGEYVPYVVAGAAVVGVLALGYVLAGVAKIAQARAVEKAASSAVERAVERTSVRRNRRRRR